MVANSIAIIRCSRMGLAVACHLSAGCRVYIANYLSNVLSATQQAPVDNSYIVKAHQVDILNYNSLREFTRVTAHMVLNTIVHTARLLPLASIVCIINMASYMGFSLPADLERHLAIASRANKDSHSPARATVKAWGRVRARVNLVSPGIISIATRRQKIKGLAGKFIMLSLVARLLFITGSNILVDGGLSRP
ncbi:hypothetical protein BJY01DRAFT_236521 [Aspergillus pseudoustus]|uniref:Uncharacterized protein n=1 Tax=Aspergillus pseudoustus TaxID=1810923 RepID=A0ABR4JLY8_9EURO